MRIAQGNCAVTKFILAPEETKLVYLNDVMHLPRALDVAGCA